jgi:hypothetical protein
MTGGTVLSSSFDDAIGSSWALPQLSRRQQLKHGLLGAMSKVGRTGR